MKESPPISYESPIKSGVELSADFVTYEMMMIATITRNRMSKNVECFLNHPPTPFDDVSLGSPFEGVDGVPGLDGLDGLDGVPDGLPGDDPPLPPPPPVEHELVDVRLPQSTHVPSAGVCPF